MYESSDTNDRLRWKLQCVIYQIENECHTKCVQTTMFPMKIRHLVPGSNNNNKKKRKRNETKMMGLPLVRQIVLFTIWDGGIKFNDDNGLFALVIFSDFVQAFGIKFVPTNRQKNWEQEKENERRLEKMVKTKMNKQIAAAAAFRE